MFEKFEKEDTEIDKEKFNNPTPNFVLLPFKDNLEKEIADNKLNAKKFKSTKQSLGFFFSTLNIAKLLTATLVALSLIILTLTIFQLTAQFTISSIVTFGFISTLLFGTSVKLNDYIVSWKDKSFINFYAREFELDLLTKQQKRNEIITKEKIKELYDIEPEEYENIRKNINLFYSFCVMNFFDEKNRTFDSIIRKHDEKDADFIEFQADKELCYHYVLIKIQNRFNDGRIKLGNFVKFLPTDYLVEEVCKSVTRKISKDINVVLEKLEKDGELDKLIKDKKQSNINLNKLLFERVKKEFPESVEVPENDLKKKAIKSGTAYWTEFVKIGNILGFSRW